MTSTAQIEANRQNAQASTGPRTPTGKRKSAGNAAVSGLFSQPGNFVRPDEQAAWDELNTAFWNELAPAGPVEAALTCEIVRAAWRLRRCTRVEAALSHHELDPMQDPYNIATQNSVDRARAQSQRILSRALADLRRLQTERQFRNEYFPSQTDTSKRGVAAYQEMIPVLKRAESKNPVPRELADLAESFSAERSQSASRPVAPNAPLLARNKPCPCGSGQKYKRCCARTAPPVLQPGLHMAA